MLEQESLIHCRKESQDKLLENDADGKISRLEQCLIFKVPTFLRDFTSFVVAPVNETSAWFPSEFLWSRRLQLLGNHLRFTSLETYGQKHPVDPFVRALSKTKG